MPCNCASHGYLVLQGDATSDDILREAGIQYAKCLLVATENDSNNISITLSARHLNSKLLIVARANRNETEDKLKLAGADRVISPYSIAGHRMANMAFQPGVMRIFRFDYKGGKCGIGGPGSTTSSNLPAYRQDNSGGARYTERSHDNSGLEKSGWTDNGFKAGGAYRRRGYGYSGG